LLKKVKQQSSWIIGNAGFHNFRKVFRLSNKEPHDHTYILQRYWFSFDTNI